MGVGFEGAAIENPASLDFELERKVGLARKINKLSQKGEWSSSYDLMCSEEEITSKSKKILEANFRDFSRKGESFVNERYIQENRELCGVNFDLAVAVEQGEISREVALILAKLYKGKISGDQIYEIASAFVAREDGEDLNDFEKRRISEINSLADIEGLENSQVQSIKNRVLSALYIQNRIEDSSARKITSWPIRSDGQIRRSFVDRSKIIDLSIGVLQDVEETHVNLDSRIAKIQESGRIPERIKSLEDILNITGLENKIKCVSFDMFDTLVEWTSNTEERHKLMIQSAVNVLQAHNIHITPGFYKKIRDEIWYKKYKNKLYPVREFKAEDAISEMVDRICQEGRHNIGSREKSEIVGEINNGSIEIDSDTATPTPGILNTLRGLKEKKVKVIVISNHPYNKGSIELLLKKYGLSEYVDDVVVSSEVGHRKTKEDKEALIFKHAIRKNNLNPDQIIHVGDNADNDFDAPKAANIKGIVFDNPESTQKGIEYKKFDVESNEYKKTCIDRLENYLDRFSSEYYARIRKENTPQELEKYALRLYNMSRDYYAPLLIKFSELCLDKLKNSKDAINLCVGRDALAMFLVQKKLSHAFPGKYGEELSKRIKYVPFSRDTALNSDPNQLKKFLSGLGIDDKQNINVVDNGILGTIQNRLSNLYPKKNFEGQYLQSVVLDGDPNKDKKHGFIYEGKIRREYDKSGAMTNQQLYAVTGPADASVLNTFTSASFIHCQEDLWNGIFSSPGILRNVDGKIQPINKRQKINFVAGNPDLIPGLNVMDNYLMLKKMALKGILDGIKIHKRKCQFGIAPTPERTILEMASWFKKTNKEGGVDKKILDGLARKRN